ncbi:MAG: MmcQ/YjbR family DNA-binding protein [Anaerolineae bacterium]
MDRVELRAYCGGRKGAEETFPFDATTLVFKVMGKMFALMPTDTPDDQPQTISLKCDPALAQVLRQTYAAVQPGYHLNKQHWNTVTLDGTIPDDEICDMIDHSYTLIVKSLKKADRATLDALE